VIGWGPILAAYFNPVHPAPRAPSRCYCYEELIIPPPRTPIHGHRPQQAARLLTLKHDRRRIDRVSVRI